jgi:hypothetical protein
VLEVRVTPIAEDGTRGETVVHDDVTDYDHEVDPDSLAISDVLVLQTSAGQVRYPLANHWVEITPDTPAVDQVIDETEQPDDLGAHPDDVRAAYLETQSRRDQVSAWAAARDMGDVELAEKFTQWSHGADLTTADAATLTKFLAYLQR